jgi:hypothetical protein
MELFTLSYILAKFGLKKKKTTHTQNVKMSKIAQAVLTLWIIFLGSETCWNAAC